LTSEITVAQFLTHTRRLKLRFALSEIGVEKLILLFGLLQQACNAAQSLLGVLHLLFDL
jgi:hypothetical protein